MTAARAFAWLGRGGFVLVLALLATQASAQITTLDATGDVGDWPGVAIGTDGLALISYYDRTNGNLKVAHCSDADCTVAALSTLDSTGDVGAATTITIGGDGLGLVTYQDVTNGNVKIAHCLDALCSAVEAFTIGAGDAGGVTTGADGLGIASWRSAAGALVVSHCANPSCSSVASTTYGPADAFGTFAGSRVALGPDGLALVAYPYIAYPTTGVGILHCQDVGCTAGTTSLPVIASDGDPFWASVIWHHNLAFGGDGLALFNYRYTSLDFTYESIARCMNADCSQVRGAQVSELLGDGSMGVGSDGLGLLAAGAVASGSLRVFQCGSPSCNSAQESPPIDQLLGHTALAVGPDGLPLLAYYAGPADLRVAHCLTATCGLATTVSVDDVVLTEGDSGTTAATFTVSLGGALSVPVSVDFATADGTATAGDYVPSSGTLTFAPGLTAQTVTVDVVGDTLDEADETFTLNLSNPQNAFILDGQGLCSIVDDDVTLGISIGDATLVEGNTGTVSAVFTVSLSAASGVPVAVDFATADGTATAPADYASTTGSLSFAPGATAQTVTVAVVGDTVSEGDETFTVNLSNPQNAPIVDGQGLGIIRDDEVAPPTTLDASGILDHTGIAMGSDGLGLISYYQEGNGDLRVAHCSDVACSSATLSTLDTVGNVGARTAIAIGGDGLGLVTYQDVTAGLVKVAHCLDVSCTSAQISTIGAGTPGDVAVGTDGLGLVSWETSASVLTVSHCDDPGCSAATSTSYGPPVVGGVLYPKLAIGPDGLGFVVYQSYWSQLSSAISTLHCLNVSCTSATAATPVTASSLPPFYEWVILHPTVAFGGDGQAFFPYQVWQVYPLANGIPPPFPPSEHIAHCANADCTQATSAWLFNYDTAFEDGSLAAGSGGLGLWATSTGDPQNPLVLFRCNDPACSGVSASPTLDEPVKAAALALGQDALPLIAYSSNGDLKVVHCLTTTCGGATPSLAVGDATVVEGNSGTTAAVFNVTLVGASTFPVAVEFATADVTAAAPGDYTPTAGTLSFAPGITVQTISVPVAADSIDEPVETFTVNLGNALNATIADGQGIGTIVDDDGPPAISVSDAAVLEGDAGTVDASLLVSLSHPSSFSVGVDWQTDATGGATATPGVDFLAASGSLVFAPGELARVVTVSVIGDSVPEPDEFFFVRLSNPTGATLDDDLGMVIISDDDAPSLSFDELVHGSEQRRDLQAQPGPVADVDYYRLAQQPLSSWEVVVDGASGDVVPVILERLAADNVTVLQTGTTATGGSSVSLRWSNEAAFPVLNQHLSVRSGGCGASCDASAVYRIRAWETTGRIARFNNSATQVTVVILENTAASPAQGTLRFWGPSGTPLWSQPFGLGRQAEYVLNTATIPALAGASGSITVSSDARFGSLQGKAVAVEPATGFSFDTPLEYRPR